MNQSGSPAIPERDAPLPGESDATLAGEGGYVAVLLDQTDTNAAALSGWAMAAFYRAEVLASRAELDARIARGRPALIIVGEDLIAEGDYDPDRLGALVKVVSTLDPAALGRLISCAADDLIILPTTKAEFVLRCRRAMAARQGSHHRSAAGANAQDPLTETLTRAALPEVTGMLAARSREAGLPLQAHVFDVRGILRANETLGRAVGDRLMIDFVDRLRRALPLHAVAMRTGGHEFAVLDLATPGMDDTARYRALVAVPFDVAGEALHADAHIGHALQGAQVETLDALIDLASANARESNAAKEGGDPRADQVPSEAEIAPLRNAIEGGELRLHYQRQINLSTGELAGAETLLRWQRPGSGLMLPGSFLPLAKRAGLLDEITRWVLAAAFIRAGKTPRLSVNVSADEICGPNLLRSMEAALIATGFARERLDVEAPFAVLGRGAAALSGLAALHEAGIGVTLESPGEVLTNTLDLRQLPITRIKLDPAFMATSRAEFVAARAHDAGIALVCGGIENPKQLANARALGCIEAQGHYLGYPQAAL